MDKEKMNDGMSKLLQNKKFINCLIVLLVVIFLWLALSTFLDNGSGLLKGNQNAPKGAQQVTLGDDNFSSKEILDYETKQKEDLEEILSQMEGVGRVKVQINFESGEVQVPATNSNTQVSQTEEDDKSGGSRVINQQTEGTTVVMKTDSSTSEPFITKTYKPQITGIIIVAEGAKSNEIKYNIQVAVSKLYDLGLDKVNVFSMKEYD